MLRYEKLLPTLVGNLDHPNKTIVREAAWAISNICAGKYHIIEEVLKYPGLVEKLINMIYTEETEVLIIAHSTKSLTHLLVI